MNGKLAAIRTMTKVYDTMLTKRDALGEEHYKMMLADYEQIRVRLKSFKGKPDQYDRLIIDMDKLFESFYRRVLNN
jgi:hypothetical protein